MKFWIALILATLPFGSLSQTPTTGKSQTSGPCSPAVSGNHNTFNIDCRIDPQQGKQMIEMLNKVLSNQIDSSLVMKKLDELLAQRGTQTVGGVDCTLNGGNCAGINNGNQVVNRYGAKTPPPQISWTLGAPSMGPLPNEPPGAIDILIVVQSRFDNPAFVITCDVACRGWGIAFIGSNTAKWRHPNGNLNQIELDVNAPMLADDKVEVAIQSTAATQKVSVVSVETYVEPQTIMK
jgi:hypothetical protein